jgi:tRNA(Ile)-lysidine synthase
MLRGNAAYEDARFCRAQAQFLGLEYYEKEMNVREIAAKRSWNIEEAGRFCRYAFFKRACEVLKGGKVATAHHMHDQAETVLINFLRGSGESGLAGIAPVYNDYIIRPMIQCSRREIDDYINEKKINYRVDATNLDNSYTRNRIRNELIPLLERDYNPKVVDSLVRTAELQLDAFEFADELADAFYKKIAVEEKNQIRIKRLEFNALPIHLKRLIFRRAFSRIRGFTHGLSFKQVQEILDISDSTRAGKLFLLPGVIRVEIDYEDIIITESPRYEPIRFDHIFSIPGEVSIPEIGKSWNVRRIKRAEFEKRFKRDDPVPGVFNAARFGSEIRIRSREPGDRIRPLGLGGTKKVKDIFIDRKIPRRRRDMIPIMLNGDEIFWIPGFAVSDDYRISGKEEEIMIFIPEEES